MARDVLGLCACPECGHQSAEIKETKSGLAYRWCPECFAQYFPKKYPQSDRLKATARPGTASGRYLPPPVQEPEPEKPAAPPAKKPAATPVQEPKPQPAKKPAIEVF